MPIVKGSYEAVFIFSMTLGEEGVAALEEKFKTLIDGSAELGEIDEWGKRRLAYPINDETEGFYVLYNFVSAPGIPRRVGPCEQDHRRCSSLPDRPQGQVRRV